MTPRAIDSAPDTQPLLTAAEAALDELRKDRPDHRHVVTWVSAHSAALQRVVYPAARHYLRSSHPAVDNAEATTRRLEHVAFRLHQWLSGDGRGSALDVPATKARLQTLIEQHLTELVDLTGELQAVLVASVWDDLLVRHERALAMAPTRPHPHIPHQGPAERVAFRLASAVDRLMDALESQPSAPVPVAVR